MKNIFHVLLGRPVLLAKKQNIILLIGKIELYESDIKSAASEESLNNIKATENKIKYLHEILATGSSKDQILKVKKYRKKKEIKEVENSANVYRKVQSGGEIPRNGLRKKSDEKKVQHDADYEVENINIHYKTVVRSELKEEIPEIVLEKVLEEKMIKVYEEMERKKKEQMEIDKENRRHNDHFLPREKKNIMKTNYTDWDKTSKRQLFGFKAKALFDFVAESPRELSFQRGNLLVVTGDVDDNWLRGRIMNRFFRID